MQSQNQQTRRLRRRPAAGNQNERGFTLIETAIALVVMMVAALAASSLFLYATNYNSGAYDRTVAIAVAQQYMEKLRKTPFDDVVSSVDDDVVSGRRHFRVVTTVTGTTLKTITLTVTPTSGVSAWIRTPITIISQRSSIATGAYL